MFLAESKERTLKAKGKGIKDWNGANRVSMRVLCTLAF
jgi:hypothetical protein